MSAARTAGTTAGKRPDQARLRYAWTSHRESGHPAARADVPRLFGADSRSGVLPGEAGRKAQACRYAGGGTDRCERSGVRLENFIVLSKMLENMKGCVALAERAETLRLIPVGLPPKTDIRSYVL